MGGGLSIWDRVFFGIMRAEFIYLDTSVHKLDCSQTTQEAWAAEPGGGGGGGGGGLWTPNS